MGPCSHGRAQSHEPRGADEYDMEYDRGRVKKVRRKGEEAEEQPAGNRFQEAWSQRGDRGSSLGSPGVCRALMPPAGVSDRA